MSVAPVTSRSHANHPTNSSAHRTDIAASETGQPTRLVERTILWTHEGTPTENLNKGSSFCSWKVEGYNTVSVWCPTEDGTEFSSQVAMDRLKRARVKEIVCLEYINDYPMNLGLVSSTVPALESTSDGSRYICTFLANNRNNIPHTLYKNEDISTTGAEFRKLYPEYNLANLDTHGVLEVKGHPFLFVDKGHPGIAAMRTQKELFQVDIDQQKLVHERWHTVTERVWKNVLQGLKKKLSKQLSNVSLTDFALELKPVGNPEWRVSKGKAMDYMLETCKLQSTDSKPGMKEALDVSNRSYSCSARLKIIYEYPTE